MVEVGMQHFWNILLGGLAGCAVGDLLSRFVFLPLVNLINKRNTRPSLWASFDTGQRIISVREGDEITIHDQNGNKMYTLRCIGIGSYLGRNPFSAESICTCFVAAARVM